MRNLAPTYRFVAATLALALLAAAALPLARVTCQMQHTAATRLATHTCCCPKPATPPPCHEAAAPATAQAPCGAATPTAPVESAPPVSAPDASLGALVAAAWIASTEDAPRRRTVAADAGLPGTVSRHLLHGVFRT